MSTASLRGTLLALLSLNVLSTLFYLVYYFDLEQFGFRISHPDVFDMAFLAMTFTQWVIVVLGIVGIVRALKQRTSPLPGMLHFPMIWYFVSGLLAWSFRLLRRPDPLMPDMGLPWWSYLFTLLFVAYATTCVLYFARERTPTSTENLRWVHPWSRLLAYSLDILLVLVLFFINVRTLAFGNSVLDDYPVLKNSPYPMMSIVLAVYYFSCEAVFSRTLGKAATGSFVVFERGRMISMLWRTLSRFLPLEAFSFIGRYEGWHDQLSRTTVRKARAQEPIGRPEDEVIRFSPPDLSQGNAV